MRSIRCENNLGSVLTFNEEQIDPFFLAHVDGIYSANNEIIVAKNAMSDGGTFQGSTVAVRNIVLTVMSNANDVDRQKYRDLLYSTFSKNSVGTLYYQENDVTRYIKYRVESVEQGEYNKRLYTISLICEDPYFYDTSEIEIGFANWVKLFEFPHEFLPAGDELGRREQKQSATIYNGVSAEDVGIEIQITANGDVVNPSVTKVQTNERIALTGFTLHADETLIITTQTNNKHIYLISNDVRTEINQYMTEDTTFFQLTRGENTIGYNADEGRQYMGIELKYRMRYEGA